MKRHPDPSFIALSSLRKFIRPISLTLIAAAALWAWLNWDPQAFMDWKREAGPVPFFAALTLLPLIGFPTTPFYILAGATFSPWVNLVAIPLSLFINVGLSFILTHSFLKRWMIATLARLGHTLPVMDKRRTIKVALLIKIAPGVPAFIKNYLIGLSGIHVLPYFAICFGITIWYAAAFVILGDSIYDKDPRLAIIAVALMLLILATLHLLRRRLAARNSIGKSSTVG